MVPNTKQVTFGACKILSAITLSLLINFDTRGQIAGEGQKFSLGAKVGGSINWVSFSEKEQKDTFSVLPAPGYTVGGFINFPLKHDYFVQMELAYSKKGRIFKDIISLTNSSSYRFVDATMLLRKSFHFNLAPNVPSEWFFSIGPEVSYWISGKGNIRAEGPGFPYKIMFDGTPDGGTKHLWYNDANRWLFSLVVGTGFRAPIGPNQSITTELRFVSGHTNLGQKYYERTPNLWYGVLGYVDTLHVNLKTIVISVSYSWDFNMLQSKMGKSTLKSKGKKKR
jgi:hypothetical protein